MNLNAVERLFYLQERVSWIKKWGDGSLTFSPKNPLASGLVLRVSAWPLKNFAM